MRRNAETPNAMPGFLLIFELDDTALWRYLR